MDLNQILAISGAINGVTFLAVGLVAVFHLSSIKDRIVFFSLVLAICSWSACYFFWLTADNKATAIFWVGMINATSLFIPITMYHWITRVFRIYRRRQYMLAFGYSISLLILPLSFSNLLYSSVRDIGGFSNWPVAGSLYWIYIVLFLFYFVAGIRDSLRFISQKNKEQASIAKYIAAALIVATLAGATNFPLWYGIHVSPFGNYFIVVFLLLFSYAILRANLMSMRSAIVVHSIALIFSILIVQLFFINDTADLIFNTFLLSLFIFIAHLLFQSDREITAQRDRLQHLTRKLSQANEELKKLDQAKSEFISVASHQLRTPLTAIRGYLSLVKEGIYGKYDQEVGEAFEKVNASNERLHQLVEDLLNISRIESGRMEFTKVKTDLSEIVHALEDTFIIRAQEKGLTFTITEARGADYTATVDASKIREVISNLIDNAIKYTDTGYVSVHLYKKNHKIHICIKDSGRGITKENLGHIFEKFHRGTTPSKLQAEGTGLGLYVCKNIIEEHGGDILVRSDGEGKGTEFVVVLDQDKN